MIKKIIGFCGAAIAALFLCPNVQAVAGGQLIADTYLPIPTAAAYSSTFSIRADGIDWASAQILLSSVTTPAQTFTDGQAATATLTVVSYVGLSTASATNKLTISSDTALVGSCISGGGPSVGSFNVCNPQNFAVDLVYSSNTACNIASAISATNVILSTCGTSGGSIVYDTSTYSGAIWNSFQIASSTAALTVSNLISSSTLGGVYIGTLAGGQDNQSFTINGKKFIANTDFYPVTSTAQTATNIATAITNSSTTIGVVASAGAGAVVFATTTVTGVAGNAYATAVSSDPALTLSTYVSSGTTVANGFMSGGLNPSYVVNTSTISIPGNNFGLGQGVILSTAAGVGITPLIVGPTYYVIINTALGTGNFELATTQANALANTPIVLTSSLTKTTQDTFTLTPSALAGTPGVQWVASNDNTHWVPYTLTPFNVAVGSTTYSSYTAGGQSNNYDLGHFDYSYIGLSFTAPTSGAVNVQAHIVGNAP